MSWKDITDLSKQVAADLKATEVVVPMISSPNFSLFDSMSAVEIMDPKMDQCTELKIGSKTVADLFKVSLPAEITLNEIVPIFMKMMVLEVSFLQGYSLIESTHNCVLLWPESWASLENDSSLVSRILLAYGKSNLKTLARWISFMTISEVYEDEDFNPSHHVLTQCDINIDEDILLQYLTSLIDEVKETPDSTYRNMLVLLLQFRVQMHELVIALDSQALSVAANAAKLLRAKKAAATNVLNISPEEIPAFPDVSILFEKIALVKSTVTSLLSYSTEAQQEEGKEQASLLDLLSVPSSSSTNDTSLTVANITINSQVTPVDQPPLNSALLQHFFRSELVRLRNISPLRVIVRLSFTESLKIIDTFLTEIQSIQTLVQAWSEPLSTAQSTHTVTLPNGNKTRVFIWEFLWQLCSQLSQRGWHVVTRSVFVGCMLVPFKSTLDVSIVGSLLAKGVPEVVVSSEESNNHWIQSSLSPFLWDVLRTFFTKPEKAFSVRWPTILQTCGHVVSEAMYVDDSLRTKYLDHNHTHNEQDAANAEGSRRLANKHDRVYFIYPWFTSFGAYLSTSLMDVYLQWMQDMDVLSVLEEMDVFYWYRDYIAATWTHALEKLKQQRVHVDRLHADLTTQEITEAEERLQAAIAEKRQKQAQFELDHDTAVSTVSGKSAKNSKGNNNKNAKNNSSKLSSEMRAQQKREHDEQMRVLDANIATLQATVADLIVQQSKKQGSASAAAGASSSPWMTVTAEEHVCKGRAQLARGLFRLILVYKSSKIALVEDKHRLHMTKAQFFARRYAAFSYIVNPAPLTYGDFISTINNSAASEREKKTKKQLNNDEQQIDVTSNDKIETSKDYQAEVTNETTIIEDPASVLQGAIVCFQTARKHFDEARKLQGTSLLAQVNSVDVFGTKKDLSTSVTDQAMVLTKVSLASVLAATKILNEVVLPATSNSSAAVVAQTRSVNVNWSYHRHFPVLELVTIPK